ncbi:unnamed protein product [Didymodactylos carnosus]|uniref:RNA helicase n=1 Tax=Didymodactylos carnosus TaxID=1234261 RepID=A0A814A7H4_9BILA|nr:unnamed protein product [Didymodactylos carnosus]CAF3691298.1 unnamed protein product [Didymodactylos carnosus]
MKQTSLGLVKPKGIPIDNYNSFDLIKTINEEEDDVPDLDDDDQEDDDNNDDGMNDSDNDEIPFNEDMKLQSRGQLSTIDEKIALLRNKRKKDKKLLNGSQTETKKTDDNTTNIDDTTTNVEDIEDESYEMEMEQPVKDKMKIKQSKKKAAKKKKEEDEYFEESPPFNPDQVFSDMKISRPLLKALATMGLHSPTPIQAATVPLALMGRDICACAVTGSGKTIAFALPVLERLLYKPHQTAPSTRVLILAPTRELCVQIHQVFRKLSQFSHNISVCLSTGGLDLKSQEASLRLQPDIVIATPGRLIDHIHNSPTFTLNNIEILILDEADRMLDEYYFEQMKEVINNCSRTRQTMLFSATMTDQIKDLIQVSLNRPIRLFIDDNKSVAPYLRQEFIRIREHREGDREAIIAALLTRTFRERVIVFAQTKRQCHRMHVMLGLLGLKIGELHGDLSQTQRLDTLKRFKNEEIDILIATDLAARGLDIENVKTIINFVLPNTLKHYIHRVGRTARAGKTGRSLSLVGENERQIIKEILQTCKVPAKMRIISQEVIQMFRNKLNELERDIEEVLKMEYGEKMLNSCEKQLDKAQSKLSSEKKQNGEGQPVNDREWFQNRADRQKEKETLRLGNHSKKKLSKQEREQMKKKTSSSKTAEGRAEFEINKVAQFQIREAKKAQRSNRLYAYEDKTSSNKNTRKMPVKRRQPSSSFASELTRVNKTNKPTRKQSSSGQRPAKRSNSGQPPAKRRRKQ